MNGLCRICAGIGLIAAMPAAAAEAGTSQFARWSHVAEVAVSTQPDRGLIELALPPEVFSHSRADLADIRLATADGVETPYVLRIDAGQPGVRVPYSPKLFNRTFLPGKQSAVTADFGKPARRTRIAVDTPGVNFRRRASVEASADGQAWQVLVRTAWLFRIASDGGTYDKNDVALPDNDFRYLRVTVFNGQDDPEEIAISSVSAWHDKSVPPATVAIADPAVAVSENDDLRATEIEIDLGQENLALHELAMTFENASFVRRVEVLSRNRRTRTQLEPVEHAPPRPREVAEPWAHLTGGAIHRLPEPDPSASLSIPLHGQWRYLLVRIFNNDDEPLRLAGLAVRRLQYFLAYEAKPDSGHRLYTGNPQAARPQYDLDQYASRLRAGGVTTAQLGPLSPNPLFSAEAMKATPWSERYKWLLWGTLLAVLAVLAAMVWRQVRQATKNPSQ